MGFPAFNNNSNLFNKLLLCILISQCFCAHIQMDIVTSTSEKYTTKVELPVLDGSISVRDIKSIILSDPEEALEYNNITIIRNFLTVKYITLEELGLKNLPVFENIPNITSLSLYNNKLSVVTSKSFSHLPIETVSLENNFITLIEDNAFGLSVTWVDLNCNQLTNINSNWFRDPSVLKVLDIRGNKIQYLQENVLQKFTNLIELDLKGNEIINIGKRAFVGPQAMTGLNLAYNNISEIKLESFGRKTLNVMCLDISFNKLNFLSKAVFNKINIQTFGVHGNPWQCPCLSRMREWMAGKNITFSYFYKNSTFGDPVCISSLSYVDKCVELVDDELYQTYVKSLTEIKADSCPV